MRVKSLQELPLPIRQQARSLTQGLPQIAEPEPPAEARRAKDDRSRFEDAFAFQCEAFGLPAFERRYRFAEPMGRRFEADFAWPHLMLLVEVNGGVWKKGGGAHSHPLDILRDIERQQYAVLLGFFMLPVTTDEVTKGVAIQLVRRVIASVIERNKPRLGGLAWGQ